MKNQPRFPVKQFDHSIEKLPFCLSPIQWTNEEDQEFEYAHCHNYYEIIWIIKGTGTFQIDLQKNSICNNQIYCIKPGQVHQLLPDKNCKGFIISFTESFLNMQEYEFDLDCQSNFFELFSKSKGIDVQHNLEEDMQEIIEKMMKEFDNLYLFRAQILRRYLKIFLIYLTRQLQDSFQEIKNIRNNDLVQNFISLLEKDFKTKKKVVVYATQLFVTPNYLNEIIKKNTGYPASHHIQQRIILEAKRLGRYSDVSMKEIAYSLGFANSAHFSKFFKTVTGINFSEFKRQPINITLHV